MADIDDDGGSTAEDIAAEALSAEPGVVVDASPGAATEKHGSTGAAKGAGGLGYGSLDQGATGGLTGDTESK